MPFAFEEITGLLKGTADQEEERDDSATNEEGNPPAEGIHLDLRQVGVQEDAQQSREHHRALLTGGLPTHVKPAVLRWSDLGKID